MTHSCPSATTLSAWLDDELDASESLPIRNHLESCAACREQVVGWMQAVSGLPAAEARDTAVLLPRPLGEGRGEGATNCVDEEILVSYAEAEMTAAEAALAEQHLRQCTHCVREIQRLIHLRMAMESPPQKAEISSLASSLSLWERACPEPLDAARDRLVEGVGVRGQALLARCREWIEWISATSAKPWPALGAVAATALLVLVIVRLLPGGAEVQFRGVPRSAKVQVIADNVIARARPSDEEPIVATLGRGTQATQLEESGGWTRIELPDGRRVWVQSQVVMPLHDSRP